MGTKTDYMHDLIEVNLFFMTPPCMIQIHMYLYKSDTQHVSDLYMHFIMSR